MKTKLYYITKNTSGKVRDKLCIEDVYIPNMEIALGFGIIAVEWISGEQVLWFKEPIRIPKFNKFYASRITSSNDPYLEDLILRILYLNPKPDALMIKKITEFIIMRFSRFELRESNIKIGEDFFMSILKFEDIEPIVRTIANSKVIAEYAPDNEVPVLFERDSTFTREEKISILAKYRGLLVKDKIESVIHTAAEHLIDKQEQIKVTHSRIQQTGMVETSKGKASIKTISKYVGNRTKKIIEDHNNTAPFKTLSTQKKYEEFLSLPEMTLDAYSSKLNVSKSTIMEFKQIINKH